MPFIEISQHMNKTVLRRRPSFGIANDEKDRLKALLLPDIYFGSDVKLLHTVKGRFPPAALARFSSIYSAAVRSSPFCRPY
jgi:hypothetical protein